MQEYKGFIIRESGRAVEAEQGEQTKRRLKKEDMIFIAWLDRKRFGIISRRYPFSNILIPEEEKENWNYSVFTLEQMEALVKSYLRFKKKEEE